MAEIINDFEKARDILQSDVLAIPTDTVYGLAANAFDSNLVAKIFEVKQRPSFDPLIVHTSSKYRIKDFTEKIPSVLDELVDKFWPGPLTIILPKKNLIPDIVTSGLKYVAIRIPNHPLTLKLLDQLDFPLAAPSANPFGYISPTSAMHVQRMLGHKISYILDGGDCSVGVESTIVGLENNSLIVYRHGGVSIEEIEEVVGKKNVLISRDSNTVAPGMLSSHYAPGIKLIIGNPKELIYDFSKNKPFLINFKSLIPDYPSELQVCLSKNGNLKEAALSLFSALHVADQSGAGMIIAELVPDEGLGKAINDRLARASFQKH